MAHFLCTNSIYVPYYFKTTIKIESVKLHCGDFKFYISDSTPYFYDGQTHKDEDFYEHTINDNKFFVVVSAAPTKESIKSLKLPYDNYLSPTANLCVLFASMGGKALFNVMQNSSDISLSMIAGYVGNSNYIDCFSVNGVPLYKKPGTSISYQSIYEKDTVLLLNEHKTYNGGTV